MQRNRFKSVVNMRLCNGEPQQSHEQALNCLTDLYGEVNNATNSSNTDLSTQLQQSNTNSAIKYRVTLVKPHSTGVCMALCAPHERSYKLLLDKASNKFRMRCRRLFDHSTGAEVLPAMMSNLIRDDLKLVATAGAAWEREASSSNANAASTLISQNSSGTASPKLETGSHSPFFNSAASVCSQNSMLYGTGDSSQQHHQQQQDASFSLTDSPNASSQHGGMRTQSTSGNRRSCCGCACTCSSNANNNSNQPSQSELLRLDALDLNSNDDSQSTSSRLEHSSILKPSSNVVQLPDSSSRSQKAPNKSIENSSENNTSQQQQQQQQQQRDAQSQLLRLASVPPSWLDSNTQSRASNISSSTHTLPMQPLYTTYSSSSNCSTTPTESPLLSHSGNLDTSNNNTNIMQPLIQTTASSEKSRAHKTLQAQVKQLLRSESTLKEQLSELQLHKASTQHYAAANVQLQARLSAAQSAADKQQKSQDRLKIRCRQLAEQNAELIDVQNQLKASKQQCIELQREVDTLSGHHINSTTSPAELQRLLALYSAG
jgi:hypothetical protein